MNKISQNYSAFHDPNTPSLADTLAKFEALPDETDSRKARARASVATIGRLLEKSPTEIPAHPQFLLRQFSRFKSQPTGLTVKSVANCKSELRYLLRSITGKG